MTMREEPSPELVELLDQLGLASPSQWRAVARRARALARDLPLFDSVWIDALVQMRRVTHFQGQELAAGRGPQLRVGDYVLCQPLVSLGYAERFLGREIATRRSVWIDLVETTDPNRDAIARQLAKLVTQFQRDATTELPPEIEAAGVDDRRIWVACAALDGTSAAEWTVRHGRFPPQVVLEIARQTAEALAQLEHAGVLHGDPCAAGLVLCAGGRVRLPLPGLRALVRPEEGHAHADLPPESYDSLAPERIENGTPPTRASDLYACGCLWWHLLTGRAPLAGGNSLAKLKAAQTGKILDVRRIAPETPAPLAAAVSACTQRDPARRPESFKQLSAALGPSTREGRAALAECLSRRVAQRSALVGAAELVRRSRHTPVWLSALAGCLLMTLALTWPMWGAQAKRSIAKLWPTTAPLAEPSPASLPSPLSTQEPAQELAPPALVETPPSAGEPSAFEAQEAQRASFEQPVSFEAPLTQNNAAEASASPLVLPVDRMIRAEELTLQPSQVVRSAPGGRAQVLISAAGLRVAVEGVRFERIDFIAAEPLSVAEARNATLAMIELAAREAEFVSCSFRPQLAEDARWAALRWSGAPGDQGAVTSHVRFADSTFAGVRVAVDCQLTGALLMDFENTLLLGPGPLWRLHRAPPVDEPIAVALRHCTLRDMAALCDVAYRQLAREPGKISIEATGCVFAPRSRAALIRLVGGERPERLLQAVDWSGQGSLLAHDTEFVAWYDAQSQRQTMDESLITIDGLVRGEFSFAAPTHEQPRDSELTDWAAPLRSDTAPGIRAAALER